MATRINAWSAGAPARHALSGRSRIAENGAFAAIRRVTRKQGYNVMRWLGLDIGGANLKIADGEGFAASRSFALWRNPERLATELRSLIAEAPRTDRLAATMTGELADCYESREEGVCAILDALADAADGRHTRVYLNNGNLVTPQVARREPLTAAASNWHALAAFVSRSIAPGKQAVLLDIGSTTTDIIPVSSSGPISKGSTDLERLVHGELLYTGVRRSPVCAVARHVPYRESLVPLAQEFFATMHDVYLILGQMPEQPDVLDTADGRPATRRHARQRLGRMICADSLSFHHRDAVRIAQVVAREQREQIIATVHQATHSLQPETLLHCGEGDFLSQRLIRDLNWTGMVVPLSEHVGPKVAQCAPAHAVAVLAREAR